MSDQKTDVLVAGYQDIGVATKDFESLVVQAKEGRDRRGDPRHARR